MEDLCLVKANECGVKNELQINVGNTKFIVGNAEHEDYTFQLYKIIGEFDKNIFEKFWIFFNKKRKVRSFYVEKGNRKLSAMLKHFDFIKLDNGDYSYFTGGLVYKLTEKKTGIFYIGLTAVPEHFDRYWGSGQKWNNHLNKNNVERNEKNIEKTILREGFKTPTEMYTAEVEEIRKYCEISNGKYKISDLLCYNILTSRTVDTLTSIICPECGGRRGHHKDSCSKGKGKCPHCGYSLRSNYHAPGCLEYKENKKCPKCGGKNGCHYKECIEYKEVVELRIKCTCNDDCKAVGRHHKKECPKYVELEESSGVCPKCHRRNSHNPSCPDYKEPEKIICDECGGKRGQHKKDCSKCTVDSEKVTCDECHKKGNRKHEAWCSKVYKCQECSGINCKHDENCPKSRKNKAKAA